MKPSEPARKELRSVAAILREHGVEVTVDPRVPRGLMVLKPKGRPGPRLIRRLY